MGATPPFVVAQRSDPGRDPEKQVNEDAVSYELTPLGHLLVVCDGMGGHASGREASHLAIATLVREVTQAAATSPPGEVLRQAMVGANRQVFAMTSPAPGGGRPGSTCVALLMHPAGTEVAHVGDSRAYLVRKGQIWPLTRDHSMVQQMVDAGLLRPQEALHHPDSNKITRALGLAPEADVELRPEPFLHEVRDLLFLVSDGVTDVVGDSDLLAMASLAAEVGNMQTFCDQVVALANARGGPDNITIQAVLVEGGAAVKAPRVGTAVTQIDIASAIPIHVTGSASPRELPAKTETSAVASSPRRARPAPTVVDEPSDDSQNDDSQTDNKPARASKNVRVSIGIMLVVLGAVLLAACFWALWNEDETPPIMPDEAAGKAK